MKKCNYCNVNIVDDTCSCPLCGGVLLELSPSENTYPNVLKKTRAVSMLFRILLFIGIVSVITCIMINYYMNFSYKSALIMTVSFLYVLWLVYLFMREDAGYRLRIFGGAVGGMMLITFIDYLFDFNKWSLDYVLPSAILLVELSFLILMFVNRRNWQSYTLVIIGIFITSLVPILLCALDIIQNPIMSQIAFIICLVVMLGVLILGGPRVMHELKRRFYIR